MAKPLANGPVGKSNSTRGQSGIQYVRATKSGAGKAAPSVRVSPKSK
ncbi:MAG: hypothetical protein JNM07_02595 [Phycisphaerae bacterium]|nr:hypothetical protein [Phycisphaerae bacterium]